MKKNKAMWENGWEGHRIAQLIRLSKLSFLEKLHWLEESQSLVNNLQSNKTRLKKSS